MRRDDVERQAAAFLAWHRKRGGPWDDDFGLWSASKFLTPAEHTGIRDVVLAELIATGEAVLTDPSDAPGAAA